jgi:hypothetical protein
MTHDGDSSRAARDEDGSGLAPFGGSSPSLFPLGLRREERLTSRLIATLELVRPFAQRFFDSLTPTGRRPTRVTKNLGGYRAVGLVEPRLGTTRHRADAVMSLRYGTFEPWRCAFEVKYLSEGRNSKAIAAKLGANQVARTYEAASCVKLDHVITISADQPEGRSNPSGFNPPAEDLEITGLSHFSWLKVLWIIRQTRLEAAKSLTAAEDRILADFESYLQGSNIWKFAREVSLGGAFASVRRFCTAPTQTVADDLLASMQDVATKWLQLADSVAQRLSIETDHLVRANGRRPTSPDSIVTGLRRTRTLKTQFRTESARDGIVSIEVDLAKSRITASWEVDVAELVPSRNPQARTRWAAVADRIQTWPSRAYSGRVSVLGPRGSVLLGPVAMRDAIDLIATSEEPSAPKRLRIERSVAATGPRGTLRGDTLARHVERAALGMAPWRE